MQVDAQLRRFGDAAWGFADCPLYAAYEAIFATITLGVTFEVAERQLSPDWVLARTNSAGTVTLHATGVQTGGSTSRRAGGPPDRQRATRVHGRGRQIRPARRRLARRFGGQDRIRRGEAGAAAAGKPRPHASWPLPLVFRHLPQLRGTSDRSWRTLRNCLSRCAASITTEHKEGSYAE